MRNTSEETDEDRVAEGSVTGAGFRISVRPVSYRFGLLARMTGARGEAGTNGLSICEGRQVGPGDAGHVSEMPALVTTGEQRRWCGMRRDVGAWTMTAAVAVLLLVGEAVAGDRVLGPVDRVRDENTNIVAGVPVRFNGLDAAEGGTRRSQDARDWMVQAVRGRDVLCELNGERTHDRWSASATSRLMVTEP